MARQKNLESPVTLFAAIATRQHEALRTIAFNDRRSLDAYITGHAPAKKKIARRPHAPGSVLHE